VTPTERRQRNAACQRRRTAHYGYPAYGSVREHRRDDNPLPRDLVEHIDGIIQRELERARKS
jgi:hypothetical protein